MNQRPWTTPIPPLPHSINQTIQFPSDDEETGMAMIGVQANSWSDFNTTSAIGTMWKYLTESAISPFHQVT